MSATSIAGQVSMTAAAPSPACSSVRRQQLSSSSQRWEPSSTSADRLCLPCHVAVRAGGGRSMCCVPPSSGPNEVLAAGGPLDVRSARAGKGASRRICHVAVSRTSLAKKSAILERRNSPRSFRVGCPMLSQQTAQRGAPCSSNDWPSVNCFTENRFRYLSPPLSSPRRSPAAALGRLQRGGEGGRDGHEGASGVRRTRSVVQAKPNGGESTLHLQPHKVNKLTGKELDALLLSEREVPLVIDFYATWCGPCLLLAQELDTLALEYGESAMFVKVDTDEEHELASQLEIRGLPTIVFVSQDTSKNAIRAEGLLPTSEIRRIIDKEL